MDHETFRHELEVALSNLRDVVQLRTMSLAAVLLPGEPTGRRGWELSRYLLEAIERVRPANDERDVWPRRRYDILTLRYVNGLSPDQVANRLAISRRHFYRQLQRALDDLSGFIWAEVADRVGQHTAAEEAPRGAREVDPDHLDLLRREAAPLLQSRQHCSLPEVWASASAILAPLLAEGKASLRADLPPSLPDVSVSPEILKQFLLSLLGEVLSSGQAGTTTLTACPKERGLDVIVKAFLPQQQGDVVGQSRTAALWQKVGDRASAKLAMLHGAHLTLASGRKGSLTYTINLPTVGTRSVLVVEDNEEVCLLFRRYLISGGFRAVVATSGADAISLARSQDFYAVTLDLMMNTEDGWDVLQALRHDPRTADLPVIVCTVLDHEELALMLGATAFLKKPVMRQQLLQALADPKLDSAGTTR